MKKHFIDIIVVILICTAVYTGAESLYNSIKYELSNELKQELKVWLRFQKQEKPVIIMEPQKEFSA